MIHRAFALVFPALLSGCFYRSRPPMQLPSVPQNLAALSSPYDDFNAAAPDWAGGRLVFSTNRGSQGAHFDLWSSNLSFSEDRVSVVLLRPYAPAIMSPQQELGPQFFTDLADRTLERADNRGSSSPPIVRAARVGSTSFRSPSRARPPPWRQRPWSA